MGVRYTYGHVSPPKWTKIHFFARSLASAHIYPSQGKSHASLSEEQHPQSYSKENIVPCRGFPANHESGDTWQLLCPTHSQATLGQILPTAEEAVRKLGAVVASLRPRPLACSKDRSHHHTLRWNEAGLRSCFRTYPTAGSFFNSAENKALMVYGQLHTCLSS